MQYTLGFSPCPNDTFIFDALVNDKIDTEGLEFSVQMEDVQTLNQLALQAKPDFTKISFGVYPLLTRTYSLLNSGSALGRGTGPLLISVAETPLNEIPGRQIAIPGEHTTAHMLFSLAFPDAAQKIFMRYDEIENFILKTENALGVIIHENRFTYAERGLNKIMDLGQFWEEKTGYPIPLGGIVAKKEIDSEIIKKVDHLIKKSIEYSFSNYPEISDYVRTHAQEMEDEIMKQHIDLYVNEYSLSLGKDGHAAISKLVEIYNNLQMETMTGS
jgi:1,4-dihydroxy-6-naphthoate synthase